MKPNTISIAPAVIELQYEVDDSGEPITERDTLLYWQLRAAALEAREHRAMALYRSADRAATFYAMCFWGLLGCGFAGLLAWAIVRG